MNDNNEITDTTGLIKRRGVFSSECGRVKSTIRQLTDLTSGNSGTRGDVHAGAVTSQSGGRGEMERRRERPRGLPLRDLPLGPPPKA